jgi:predicted RNA binding protein YcfA (HicA-like mRNA interferase family)
VSRRDKLVARLGAFPPQMAFDDVKRVIEAYGGQLANVDGSHHRFRAPGKRSIVVTVEGGRWVKRYKLKEVWEWLGLD